MSEAQPGAPELEIREIDKAFARCVAIGDMRSLGAVMRIAKEQIAHRTGYEGIMAMHCVDGVLVLFGIGKALSMKYVPAAEYIGAGVLAGTLIELYRFTMRFQRRRFQEEKALVVSRMFEAMGEIIANPKFEPEPLDDDERKFLRSLRKNHPQTEAAIDRLLGVTD